MLEPSSAAALAPGRLRALAVRHGLDLEPELPDPAPAYVDPEGALHPALTEPLAAMPLHSWPTAASRASLVARALSEPGHFDPSDKESAQARLARFAQREGMEPEARGALALLLLRGLLATQQRGHRPSLPDPEAMLEDPNLDAFRRRRARLRDAPGWRQLADDVMAAAGALGGDRALAFERVVVQAAARWLPAYIAWGDVIDALGPEERIPAEPAGRSALRDALSATRRALATLAGEPVPEDAVGALQMCLAGAIAAEQRFLEQCEQPPDGPVQAKWMLAQQIRSMRDLSRFTRPGALTLHDALRECDVLRLGAHLAWRLVAITLWLADAEGDDSSAVESQILALPDPPHATFLGAGLGRLRGFVLLRRLRRGDHDQAAQLADAALRLAPEELAVRITANDLRFASGERTPSLLSSLREEGARYRSLSVALMGTRVADALGDAGRARHFREEMLSKASPPADAARWLVHAGELLRVGGTSRELQALLATVPEAPPVVSPLLHLVGAGEDVPGALADAESALLDRLQETEDRDASRRALAERGGRIPGWRKVLTRTPVSPESTQLCGDLYDRLSDLRAAAPALRSPPVSPALRRLCAALSRAADGGEPPGLPTELLAGTQATVASLLSGSLEPGPASESLWVACRALEASQREPRVSALRAELRVLRARARAGDHAALESELATLSAHLDSAVGAPDPDEALDALDDALLALDEQAREPVTEADLPMTVHPEFERFSQDELGIRADALRRARQLIALFNEADGRRDRKRLRGTDGQPLFELRHRTRHFGGLRVYYRPRGQGWEALAAMSKYDDRPQRAAIARILAVFGAS